MEPAYYKRLSDKERSPIDLLAVLDVVTDFESPDNTSHITRVNVPRPFRGLGVATELLKRACSDADAAGRFLTVHVSPSDGLNSQQLHAWYRRHGFEGTGRLTRAPKVTAC